jgi:putative toxin-antitoxin system antitoxin component (TIGR02293 family)
MMHLNSTALERIMSSAATTTALQDLWSILLSRLASDGEAPRNEPARGPRAVAKERLATPYHLSAGQAYAIVKVGIPSRSLTPLSAYLGLGKGAVAGYLDLDRATATRKEAKDEMLPTYAAESLLRLLELDSLAKETFETPAEAAGWMRQPHPMLDGESPLECAKSGFGAQRVKDILVAVKYGGVV